MEISFMDLIILALASFRLTRLIVYDKITEFIRDPFFDEVNEKDESGKIQIYLVPKKGAIRGFFGELLSCYWCFGIWSSLLLSAFYLFSPNIAVPILLVLAVAGLAALIETIVQRILNE